MCGDVTLFWGRVGFFTTRIIVAPNSKFRKKLWTNDFNNFENLRDA
jgi:hypothetical protein